MAEATDAPIETHPADEGRRPFIGLPGRRKISAQVEGFPATLDRLEIDMYLADYAKAVLHAGGLPVHLPMDADPLAYLPILDGIVLSGGADVEPDRYDAENTASDTEPLRDALEFALLEGAIADELPVLGICRGLQVLNVHAGGTLHQDVPEHARYDVDPGTRTHDVFFETNSRLGLMYSNRSTSGAVERGIAEVNSLHHQTVDAVGEGLLVSARAIDGTVEGLEMAGADVIAVQWHPEMLDEPEPVFEWLVKRARARAAR